MTRLSRVLYCSRSQIPGGSEVILANIESILAASRENNRRAGISGALLFSDGCFAQVLEGDLDAVDEAFERIQCDERHRDVTVLESGPIAARDFPSWSMAFAGAEAARSPIAGIAVFDSASSPSAKGRELMALLKDVVVRETHWLPTARRDAGEARPGVD
ncbi:BLUF domain-containing protein [Lichenicola sp.]|uniref:BLUF domain-containing protein n=1 Tax=Lichenicola sp. TaxID=2804529 RepID=UPI003AFFE0A8